MSATLNLLSNFNKNLLEDRIHYGLLISKKIFFSFSTCDGKIKGRNQKITLGIFLLKNFTNESCLELSKELKSIVSSKLENIQILSTENLIEAFT